MPRIIIIIIFLNIFNSSCKKDPLPVPPRQGKVEGNSNKERTISRIVIHSMDFVNYSAGDGTTGPDLYFEYYDPLYLNIYGDTYAKYTYSDIKINITPSMLPLTVNLNCQSKGMGISKLIDFDGNSYSNLYYQDVLTYDIQQTEEFVSGNEFAVFLYDVGSNFTATLYYTYN